MNRKVIIIVPLAVLVLSLAFLGLALAQESEHYRLQRSVMGSAGSPINSSHYAMNSTTGQAVIGSKSSTSYGLGSGYWPGALLEYLVHLPLILKNYTP